MKLTTVPGTRMVRQEKASPGRRWEPPRISDRHARRPPALRREVASSSTCRPPRRRDPGHRPRGASSPDPSVGASRLRPEERADLGAVASAPAPDQLPDPGGAHRALAIGSKFVLRVGGKHVFNPTNFALVAMMLLTGGGVGLPRPVGQHGRVRVPPRLGGRAGREPGGAERRHPGFLACYTGVLAARSLWLGEPMSIPCTGSRAAPSCSLPSS